MIGADGGNGLPAALSPVHPDIPVRRCWAHKIRNVLNKVRKPDHEDVKRHLHDIMNAPNLPAVRHFAARWRDACPKAVECLRDDLDDLPAHFRYPTPDERKNAYERLGWDIAGALCYGWGEAGRGGAGVPQEDSEDPLWEIDLALQRAMEVTG